METILIPRIQSDHRLEMTSGAKSLAGGQASKATPVTLPCMAALETPHCDAGPLKAAHKTPEEAPQPSEGLPLKQVAAPDEWFGSALLTADDDDHRITDEEHQINDEIVTSRLLAELLPGTKRKAPEKLPQAAAATVSAASSSDGTPSAAEICRRRRMDVETSSACRSEARSSGRL